MLIFLTIINNLLKPYWDVLRKKVSLDDISPLTITHAPNIFGHPIGIIILLIAGVFILPDDYRFFLFWFIMIGIAAISSILHIWSLTRTNFFGVQIIGRLGFVTSTIFAVLILGEELNSVKMAALLLAVTGVIIFAWPKNIKNFKPDRGLIFAIGAVIVGGLAVVFYKIASFYVPNYFTFLTGRFIGDAIGWTLIWFIGVLIINRNPIKELKACILNKSGRWLIFGVATEALLTSWLIYKLPVSLLAVLSTLIFPASYFFSRIKLKERISKQMWTGTVVIIIAVSLFITSSGY